MVYKIIVYFTGDFWRKPLPHLSHRWQLKSEDNSMEGKTSYDKMLGKYKRIYPLIRKMLAKYKSMYVWIKNIFMCIKYNEI